jgi:hypothetical protein
MTIKGLTHWDALTAACHPPVHVAPFTFMAVKSYWIKAKTVHSLITDAVWVKER